MSKVSSLLLLPPREQLQRVKRAFANAKCLQPVCPRLTERALCTMMYSTAPKLDLNALHNVSNRVPTCTVCKLQ